MYKKKIMINSHIRKMEKMDLFKKNFESIYYYN